MAAQARGELPGTMRAVAIDSPGGPDILRIAERDVPVPGEGQVLVRTAFAGVNHADLMQREGKYPPPPGASETLGLEVSGEVVALGNGVAEWLLGRNICALLAGGGYAEYCLVDHRHCLVVPDGLDMVEAGAMPEALFTVWHNLFQRGYARDGETVLIHGGTSGIGTMATRLCRLFGIRTITTNGSDSKCKASQEIGADHAINYNSDDFVEGAHALTDGKGVDLILDIVGGDYLPRNMKALAEEGRCVSIAVPRGVKAEINIVQMMARRLTLTGSTLRARSDEFKALLTQEIESYCWPLVENGELRPVIDTTCAITDVAMAHERMGSSEHIGKLVLDLTR